MINRDKESFRGENEIENDIRQMNIFFDYLLRNELFSLNLRKFLEENCEPFEENESFNNYNFDKD